MGENSIAEGTGVGYQDSKLGCIEKSPESPWKKTQKTTSRSNKNFLIGVPNTEYTCCPVGWLGMSQKVSCILHHRGVQIIFAYSWAKPAILAEGKGRRGMFLFLLFFSLSFIFLSPLPLSFISSTVSYLSSPFLWQTTQNDPQG